MENFFEKISNYQFLNNLLPGTIFVSILNNYMSIIIKDDNLLVSLFIYYFMGIIISRFGSIVIEPILKKVKFVNYQTYSKYIFASNKDKNINLLLELNNLFRSMIAMLCLVALVAIYSKIQVVCPFLERNSKIILLLLLTVLFLFSFRKQTKFIFDRIEYHENKTEGDEKK